MFFESLSNTELDLLDADLWTMSPPCQPFTRSFKYYFLFLYLVILVSVKVSLCFRQGKQKDLDDNRTNSFIHLLNVLQLYKFLSAF